MPVCKFIRRCTCYSEHKVCRSIVIALHGGKGLGVATKLVQRRNCSISSFSDHHRLAEGLDGGDRFSPRHTTLRPIKPYRSLILATPFRIAAGFASCRASVPANQHTGLYTRHYSTSVQGVHCSEGSGGGPAAAHAVGSRSERL
jgi:hypothetical protein